MFQTPKRVGLTLPSVEQPTIFRDPPRALFTRRSEKVDVADTMHRASTEDRIDENINWVPRGVDPVAGVQFSNGAGMTPNFSARVQGHAPYKVAKDGAFRPPMRRQEDELPVSRMPRLATSFHVNQGADDLAVRRGDAHYAVPSDSHAVLAEASGARTSFRVAPAVPGSNPGPDPSPVREDYGLPAAKAQDVAVGIRAPGTGSGSPGGDIYRDHATAPSLSAYAHAPRHLDSGVSIIDADPGGYRRARPMRPVHMPAPAGYPTRPVLQHPRETAHRQTRLAGSVSVPVVGYPAARTVHADHTTSTTASDRFRPPPGLSVPAAGYPTRGSVVPQSTLPAAPARPRVQASASVPAHHQPRAQTAATLSESTFVRPPREVRAPAPVPRTYPAPASARVDADKDPGAGLRRDARPAASLQTQVRTQAYQTHHAHAQVGPGQVRAQPVPVPVAVPLSGQGGTGTETDGNGNGDGHVRPENRATGGDRFAPATYGGPSPGWAESAAGNFNRDIEPISTSVLAPRNTSRGQAGVLQWSGREREPLQVSVQAQAQAQAHPGTVMYADHPGFGVRDHLPAPAAPPAVALQGPINPASQSQHVPNHRTPLRANPHVSVSGQGGGGENGIDHLSDGMTSKAVSADYQHTAMTVPGGSQQKDLDPYHHTAAAAPRNTPLTHMRTALQPPHPVLGSAADSAAGPMPTRPESFGHVHAPKPDIGLRHEGWDFGARREAQRGIGMGEDRNIRGYSAGI